MHTRIFPAPTFFFIIIAITLVQFPPSVHTVDDELYLNCSSTFECAGTSNLSYPFWGSNRPEYCGHPGFQLTCSGDAPLLNVTDMYYRVLKINGPARSLKIARADYWNTTCPANYANTTIDFSKIFSHTSDTTNLTLYYQCQYDTSSLLPNPSADGFPFTCDGDAEGEANYYWSSSPATTNENLILDACPYNVTVPVMKSVVESDTLTTEDALKKAIDGGFTVEWNANDIRCDRCEVSGGQCGFNTSTNAFVCHCKTGSSPFTCESTRTSDGGSTSGPNANNSSMCNRCEVSGGQCGLNNSTNAFVCHCKTGSSPFTCESTRTSEGGSTSEWNDANNSSMCDRCKGSGGLCGFNTSTNAFVCHCTTGSSPFTCESTKASWKLRWWIIMIIGSAGVVLFSFVIVCCVKRGCLSNNSMVWRKRDAKNDHDHFNAEEVLKNFGSMAPKRYTYSEVKKLTNSFKDKVGHGGYGVVYKGKLADGSIVAVKVLGKSNDNGLDFINEVASISRTSHVNIVTLLGFCYGRTKRALIYEFVPNGSLDKFINDKVSSITKSQLDCKTMFKIALGIARGLEYLHRGCRTRILHFDIKPHNILLDEDLCPKISDFGLAKLCKTKESIVSMTGMRGTPGYIAPEVFRRCFGGVSHKSDVYSYGMLVLDMVGERKRRVGNTGVSHSSEIYFPDCIYDKLEQDREGFSSTCERITSRPEEEDMFQKMIVVSLWCIQTNPSERPSMGKVIEMLEGSLQSLQLPPKPSANSPTILSAQD